MRRTALVSLVLLIASAGLAGACGGGGGSGGPATVTGRVVSLHPDDAYCVSPDRGRTQTCVDIPDPKAIQGVDVGECVTTTADLTSEGSKVEVVDEAACAAGDLGD